MKTTNKILRFGPDGLIVNKWNGINLEALKSFKF